MSDYTLYRLLARKLLNICRDYVLVDTISEDSSNDPRLQRLAIVAMTFATILLLFAVTNISHEADISESQLTKTLQIFNSICQTKLNISDAQIVEVKKHPESFADDSQEKCFATCVLEMFNMVIDGKVPVDLANESIGHFLPNGIKTTAQNALEVCRNALDDSNNIHCVVGYKMLKCLATNNMKFFLL